MSGTAGWRPDQDSNLEPFLGNAIPFNLHLPVLALQASLQRRHHPLSGLPLVKPMSKIKGPLRPLRMRQAPASRRFRLEVATNQPLDSLPDRVPLLRPRTPQLIIFVEGSSDASLTINAATTASLSGRICLAGCCNVRTGPFFIRDRAEIGRKGPP